MQNLIEKTLLRFQHQYPGCFYSVTHYVSERRARIVALKGRECLHAEVLSQ